MNNFKTADTCWQLHSRKIVLIYSFTNRSKVLVVIVVVAVREVVLVTIVTLKNNMELMAIDYRENVKRVWR